MRKDKYCKPVMTNLGNVVNFTFGGQGWGGDVKATRNSGGGGGSRPPITGHEN